MEDTTDQSRLPENIRLENLGVDEEDLWDNEEREEETALIRHSESDDYHIAPEYPIGRTQDQPSGSGDVGGIMSFLDTLSIEGDVIKPRFANYLIERAGARIDGPLLPSVMANENNVTL